MGKNDVVIFGSGAREACLAEAFLDRGYDVGNITTDKDQTLVNVEGAYALGDFYSNADQALGAVRDLSPKAAIIQEESLLFQGVATHLRGQGVDVVGADMTPSALERSKPLAMRIIRERFPGLLPKSLLFTSDPSELDNRTLPDKYVVRSQKVEGAATTVIVHNEQSKRKAAELMRRGQVMIEEFVEGKQLTYYVFTDGKTVQTSPPLRTYPFRFDDEQGDKTGGMGCVMTEELVGTPFVKAARTVEQLAHHITKALSQNGNHLQCFSIEAIVSNEGVTYIESDVRLGDPEVCLLNELMGRHNLADLLLALSWQTMTTVNYTKTDGLSIVVAPTSYPHASPGTRVDGSWVTRLRNRSGGRLHLGRVKACEDGMLKLSGSRTAVYSRAGACLALIQELAYSDLMSADIPSALSFRRDIGFDITGHF